MYKKFIFPVVPVVMFTMSLFSIAGAAAVPTPEQQVQIRAERMQLESERKKTLMNCNQFKEVNPDSYARCVREHTVRHEANVQLLMQDADVYFAKKAAGSKN
ncbi:MAG: hypothetical protein Q7U88_05335 [Desulfocapsaceae bacterium]|nr:hypothetical protein [Desulfocapsaceae bacterium]